jgi:hypothetical protein
MYRGVRQDELPLLMETVEATYDVDLDTDDMKIFLSMHTFFVEHKGHPGGAAHHLVVWHPQCVQEVPAAWG